jgi:predicted transposase/invertase (TIGR01784 family)
MDRIASPHDTFFRESFTRSEVARDFLRCQLPAALLAELDLTTLTIGKDSYVASDLRTAYSDLVYRVAYRGEALNVYLLFEHKSWAEHWTALQLLRYIAAEGEQYRKQHPKTRHLPPVLPLVIYHGERPWQAPAASKTWSSRCRTAWCPSCRASATSWWICPAPPTPRSRAGC